MSRLDLDGAAGPTETGTAPIPVDPTLIAGYLDHLGAAEARLVVEHIVDAAEALLDRIEAAALTGVDGEVVRHLAHDVAGTLGSLGCSVHAAMARAVETSEPVSDPGVLLQRLQPLLAARDGIASSAMAVLDGLLSVSEEST